MDTISSSNQAHTQNSAFAQEIYKILDHYIVKDACVLCWDYTLVEQLPDILKELHFIQHPQDASSEPMLRRLFELVDPEGRAAFDITALPRLIVDTGIDLSKYSTRCAPEHVPQDTTKFPEYTTGTASEDAGVVEQVLKMQQFLGQGRQNKNGERYSAHLIRPNKIYEYLATVSSVPMTPAERRMNTSFWGVLLEAWKMHGWLRTDLPSLSIGPRWLTEIFYFRQVHGLTRHIGLDLFSDDPSLVVAGDMHKIPFPDGHFSFIFLKNVMDKSYNIRLLVKELLRVIAPGGIIVTDHNTKYLEGTPLYGFNTPFTRTEIQEAQNLLRVFQAQAAVRSLICQNVDLSGLKDSTCKYNARLAIRVPKNIPIGEFEPISSYINAADIPLKPMSDAENPHSPQNLELMKVMKKLLNDNHYTEALAIVDALIVYLPEQSSLYYAKAVAETRLGRTTEAQSTLQTLLFQVPDHGPGQALLNQLRG